MYADKDYILAIRHELHQYPEIGFDLPRTLALVRRELDALGIEYSEQYGESAIVATINPACTDFTIGIRADMDALPIHEKNDLPYRSQIDGVMHACGHDAHTAMLLGTARALHAMRDRLTCRVKLLFQPSEEGARSGAEEMVLHGVMDDIDIVIGLHIDNLLQSGMIGVCVGASMASSRNIKLEFFGKTAHATLPHTGRDALAAAVATYNAIQQMLGTTMNPFAKYVCTIGRLSAGTAHNIVADYADMLLTVRAFDMALDRRLDDSIRALAAECAARFGCTSADTSTLKAFVVYNDPYISELVLASAQRVLGASRVTHIPEKLSSEDFSQYLTRKPGVFFRLGTRNEQKGCGGLQHNNDFILDEDALPAGTDTCVQFVLDHMGGIDLTRVENVH